jgi:hypothetical protein
MALVGLKKYAAARDAMRKGLDLAPGDKNFISQMDKLRGEAYQYDGAPSSTKSATATPIPKLPVKKASSTAVKNDDSSEKDGPSPTSFSKGSTAMRGYKTTSDGRKTTFFNNELDEKTKDLIGDITPKAIDVSSVVEQGTTSTPPVSLVHGWCCFKLGTVLMSIHCVYVCVRS